ncbi:calcium-binding protein [Phyllobacterium sp. YR531]|uniref:calcium-binding protein n=1 Tax=Phyllobacterium sp. YR531 TaxID=1144343 RepID=UPI00026F6CFF|nr:calcium-binding protein [Phyllobacterium sp. YR531]EJN01628.1 putative calcium-binding protein [Phyllobacterium sp. YR531]
MGETYVGTNGDDRFVQGSESEVTVEALGGNDEIILDLSDDNGGFNTVYAGSGNDRVENRYEGGNDVDLGSGDDVYIGEGFAFSGDPFDVVKAGDGNDRFDISTRHSEYYGEGGNDTFNSEGWENIFDGGSGIDTISYALRDSVDTKGVTIDLDREFADTGENRREKLVGIENAIGTKFSDTIFGTVENNSLSGRDGNDDLIGLSGNDVLDGGTGADRMYGGAGNDTYFVDNAGDIVNEVTDNASGVDTVNSSISFSLLTGSQLSGNVENLTLIGTASINATGNNLANVLVGNAAANILTGNGGDDLLNGGAGADILSGGVGSDRYVVDNIGDRVIEGNVAGIDTVQSSVSFAAGGQHIENIVLTGSGNINASGNALANSLTGNSGNNALDGGAGADIMAGGAGNDKYYVDNAGDRIIEGNVAGIDVVSSSVSFSAGAQFIENIVLTGSASINATGNALNNYLVGNTAANILSGGLGNDTLTGGEGRDAFFFNTAPNGSTNRDTITDFNVPADTVWMENAVFTALGAPGALAAAAFHIGAGATDAADRIIYNSTTGGLYYDADGSGSGSAIQFASLTKGLALTNADFLIV